jgi:hypothetical protein
MGVQLHGRLLLPPVNKPFLVRPVVVYGSESFPKDEGPVPTDLLVNTFPYILSSYIILT